MESQEALPVLSKDPTAHATTASVKKEMSIAEATENRDMVKIQINADARNTEPALWL